VENNCVFLSTKFIDNSNNDGRTIGVTEVENLVQTNKITRTENIYKKLNLVDEHQERNEFSNNNKK